MITEQTIINNKQINVAVTSKMSLPSDLAIIALIGDRLRTAQITVHDLGSIGLCLIYYSPSG